MIIQIDNHIESIIATFSSDDCGNIILIQVAKYFVLTSKSRLPIQTVVFKLTHCILFFISTYNVLSVSVF